MRLIDADKLYDWVRTECNPYGKPTIDFESGNRMLDMIKRSSTDFDKEKVIDELKSAENYLYVNGRRITNFKFIHTLTAIEIVEKGGIEFLH